MTKQKLSDPAFLDNAISRATRFCEPVVGALFLDLKRKCCGRITAFDAETVYFRGPDGQSIACPRPMTASIPLLYQDFQKRRNGPQILRDAGFPEDTISRIAPPPKEAIDLSKERLPGLSEGCAAPVVLAPENITANLPDKISEKRAAIAEMIADRISAGGQSRYGPGGIVTIGWLPAKRRLEVCGPIEQPPGPVGFFSGKIAYQVSMRGRILAINSHDIKETTLPAGHYEALAKILRLATVLLSDFSSGPSWQWYMRRAF